MALRFFVRFDPATQLAQATLGPYDIDAAMPAPYGYVEVDPAKAPGLLARTQAYDPITKQVSDVAEAAAVETQLDRIEAAIAALRAALKV